MIKEAIIKLVNKGDLSFNEARGAMREIMNGETTSTQNAAFLAALSTKNAGVETIEEIVGCAVAVRERSIGVDAGADLLDIVGTGGDGSCSFNISTVSAIVAASGGVKTAKHGARASSSLCGSADCLEALGVNIETRSDQCVKLLNEVGMCFFFAPNFSPALKRVSAIRKELGVRTVFNILGPLANPASPKRILLGVYDERLLTLLAQVLIELGVERGMTVCGQDGLDELSLSAPTSVCEINNGSMERYVVAPEDFGLSRACRDDLKGGGPEENAAIARAILSGERGHKRDAVLLNAGAALYIGGKADSVKNGVELAAPILDSGKALETLNKLAALSSLMKTEARV